MIHPIRDIRARRGATAKQRARTMNTAQLTAGHWEHSDERRWNRVFMALMMLGGALFYLSSTANDRELRDQNRQLRSAIVAIVAARVEGRMTTCGSDRHFEIAHNGLAQTLEDYNTHLLTDAANAGPPAQHDATLAYMRQRNTEIDRSKVQTRDCTTAGINAFYKNTPPVPACLYGGNGKGLCNWPPTTTTTSTP